MWCGGPLAQLRHTVRTELTHLLFTTTDISYCENADSCEVLALSMIEMLRSDSSELNSMRLPEAVKLAASRLDVWDAAFYRRTMERLLFKLLWGPLPANDTHNKNTIDSCKQNLVVILGEKNRSRVQELKDVFNLPEWVKTEVKSEFKRREQSLLKKLEEQGGSLPHAIFAQGKVQCKSIYHTHLMDVRCNRKLSEGGHSPFKDLPRFVALACSEDKPNKIEPGISIIVGALGHLVTPLYVQIFEGEFEPHEAALQFQMQTLLSRNPNLRLHLDPVVTNREIANKQILYNVESLLQDALVKRETRRGQSA